VPEKEETSHDVNQDDYCSDTEHVVHQGGVDEVAQLSKVERPLLLKEIYKN
jgi:hypothetical protein